MDFDGMQVLSPARSLGRERGFTLRGRVPKERRR